MAQRFLRRCLSLGDSYPGQLMTQKDIKQEFNISLMASSLYWVCQSLILFNQSTLNIVFLHSQNSKYRTHDLEQKKVSINVMISVCVPVPENCLAVGRANEERISTQRYEKYFVKNTLLFNDILYDTKQIQITTYIFYGLMTNYCIFCTWYIYVFNICIVIGFQVKLASSSWKNIIIITEQIMGSTSKERAGLLCIFCLLNDKITVLGNPPRSANLFSNLC